MSLRPRIYAGNWSRGTDNHLVGGSADVALAITGTSSDVYQVVRTIALCQSGVVGLVLRFNELPSGSRQYYQFRVNVSLQYASIEEVNYSTIWGTPTLLQSRAFTSGYNQSNALTFEATNYNRSQDHLKAYINDMVVLDYISALTFSSGGCGFLVQSGLARFDSNSVVGTEIDYYCTVQDVINLLKGVGVTAVTNEGEIQAMIAAASREINAETETAFGRAIKVEGERHEGAGEAGLVVDHPPIVELYRIQLLNYNGDVAMDLKDSATDFVNLIIEKDIGVITRPPSSLTTIPFYGVGMQPIDEIDQYKAYDYVHQWGTGRRNIIVDYSYGHLDVPQDVWDAARKQAGIELLVKMGSYNSQGAAMIRLGDAMEDYRFRGNAIIGDIPYAGHISKWMADVAKVIARYKAAFIGDV